MGRAKFLSVLEGGPALKNLNWDLRFTSFFFLFFFFFFFFYKLQSIEIEQGNYPLGPLEIEAKVMEEGVQFAWDVGICEVFFECDSMIIAKVLLGHGDPPMAIRNIIEGIRHKLQDFQQF